MKETYDPTDLLAQQDQQRDAGVRKRVVREREASDIKWLMSSPRGRRLMRRLLAMAGPTRLSFDTNAMRMAFNEGRRNLGLQLLDEVMELCPEMYTVMEKEFRDDRENGEREK